MALPKFLQPERVPYASVTIVHPDGPETTIHPKASHTPGPWRVDPTDRHEVLTADNRFRVLLTTTGAGDVREVWAANARLIAAAPEMLSALRIAEAYASLNTINPRPPTSEQLAALRSIIAKAEGQS